MEWNTDGKNNYSSYIFLDGKSISFRVLADGHYIGIINNPDNRSSAPEIYIAGFCHSYEDAIDYIDKYVTSGSIISSDIELKDDTFKDIEIPSINKSLDSVAKVENKLININKSNWLISTNTEADNIVVTMTYNNPNAVIKYTTNGKHVMVTSKIYREPFIITKGSVLNAAAFLNKEKIDKYSQIIS